MLDWGMDAVAVRQGVIFTTRGVDVREREGIDMARATFEFHPDTEKALEDLKQFFRASSKAEILRKSIALLALAKEVQEAGGEMAVIDKKGKQKNLLIQ